PSPTPPLFPYTTLFRSAAGDGVGTAGTAAARRSGASAADLAGVLRGIKQKSVRDAAAWAPAAREFGYCRTPAPAGRSRRAHAIPDRKSTRLNSSHVKIS